MGPRRADRRVIAPINRWGIKSASPTPPKKLMSVARPPSSLTRATAAEFSAVLAHYAHLRDEMVSASCEAYALQLNRLSPWDAGVVDITRDGARFDLVWHRDEFNFPEALCVVAKIIVICGVTQEHYVLRASRLRETLERAIN